jgi:tetratricopeptide (TPR) repeat protein
MLRLSGLYLMGSHRINVNRFFKTKTSNKVIFVMEDNDSQNQHNLRSFSQPIALPVTPQERPPELVIPIELQKQMDELQAQDPESPLQANLIRDIDKAREKLFRVGGSFDYSKTEKLYQKDLELFERIAPDHPILASSFSKLAELYRSQGKYRAAEPLYLRSLEIRERQLEVSPHPVVSSLNNLAALYKSQAKYSEAELIYLRSLEIWEHQLGADHPDVATSLNNLAALYYSQGKYSEAEPLYLRSLAIFEVSLGNDHPNTKTIRDNLQTLRDKLTQTT